MDKGKWAVKSNDHRLGALGWLLGLLCTLFSPLLFLFGGLVAGIGDDPAGGASIIDFAYWLGAVGIGLIVLGGGFLVRCGMKPKCFLLICILSALLLLLPPVDAVPGQHHRKAAKNPLNAALVHALYQRDNKQVKQLLNKGAGPNAVGHQGETALMIAAGNEDPQMINLLLRRGARVNARDQEGQTALMKSAIYLLTEWDLNDFVSQGDVSKKCPMTSVMKLLADKGAKINAKDKQGRTALMLTALYAQSPGCVKLLLSRNADVHMLDRGGNSVLDYAILGRDHGDGKATNAEVIHLIKQAGGKSNRYRDER